MLFNLFSKKKKPREEEVLTDLSVLRVDIHSHLIPGIDDGAKNLEDSIALISGMKNLGFRKLITTPHIMSDYYRNTSDSILAGVDKVRKRLQELSIDIELDAAAEYYYDENFLDLLRKKELLSIGDGFVLFELSLFTRNSGVAEVIKEIQEKGYKPLLAHPERYNYLKMEDYVRYKEMGCYFQLNLLSTIGYYGKATKQLAEILIEKGCVDFVSSDLHHGQHLRLMNTTVRKDPKLRELIHYGALMNPLLIP